MTDEDLLTTNNLADNVSKDFLNIKKNKDNKYESNLPQTFKDIPKETVTSFVSENSIGYDQFNELADTEKKKKTIRTVVNVDSKNRKTNFSFRKTIINPRADIEKLVYFYNNSDYFYLITDDTFLENYKFYKELIFTNFSLNLTTNLNTDKFIFDESLGEPILKVNSLIYNTVTNSSSQLYLNPRASSVYNKINYFDKSSNKYVFNIIELQLPNKVNPKEVNTIILNESVKAYFITDVKSSYNTASHYKITLDRSYSNIYSIRLISSEIPNTAYTFQGNEIVTNIGNFKLSTKINNRLRWINYEDRYSFLNYTVSQLKLYNTISPSYLVNTNQVFHTNQNKINNFIFNVNLHSLKINLLGDTNIILLNTNSKYKMVMGNENSIELQDSTEIYNKINYYTVSTYNEEITSFFVNSNNLNYDNFNSLSLTSYYLNNISLDYIKITSLGEDNIILLNQQQNYQNNLYYNKNNVLYGIVIFNPGENYTENDISLLDLYQYNYNIRKYESLNININEYFNFEIDKSGRIDNIYISNFLTLDKINNNDDNIDYFLGFKGILNNSDYIRYFSTKPSLKKYTGLIENVELNYSNNTLSNPDIININYNNGKIKKIQIVSNNNVYLPNEYLTGKFIIGDVSYELSFMITDESLTFNYENHVIGSGLRLKLLISNQLIPIINYNNESDYVRYNSYLKFIKSPGEEYNYIYECIDGKYHKNTYYEIEKDLYYKFQAINYYERIQKRSLYLRSYKININNSLSLNNRDYYNDFTLIGIPNSLGLDQRYNRYLNSTVSIINKSMIYKLDKLLNCFSTLSGYVSNQVDDNNSFLYFNFIDTFSLDINVIASKNNYYNSGVILNILENNSLPIKISILSLDNISIYNYYIQNIEFKNVTSSGRLKQIFRFNMLPINGSFDEDPHVIPFQNINDKTSKCIILIHNSVDYSKINLMNLNRPDYGYFFKKYYSTLEGTMLLINNDHMMTYSTMPVEPHNIFNYSNEINKYLVRFLTSNNTSSVSETDKSSTNDNIVCLKSYNEITVVNNNGKKYIFNNEPYNPTIRYALSVGIYTFNVPHDHPMAILNYQKETLIYYTGENLVSTLTHSDGNIYNFYTGKITIEVYNNFGTVSIWCAYHGNMGGNNKLTFFDSCKSNDKIEIETGLIKKYGIESKKYNIFTIHYEPNKIFSIDYQNDNTLVIDYYEQIIKIDKMYGIYTDIYNDIEYYTDLELELNDNTNISFHMFQIKKITSPNHQAYDYIHIKDKNIGLEFNSNFSIKFKFIIKHTKNINSISCLIPLDKLNIISNLESCVLRISHIDKNFTYRLKYLELFVGNCVNKYTLNYSTPINLYKYEAKFKNLNSYGKIEEFLNLTDRFFAFNCYTCHKKVFLRPYISKLINPQLDNLDRDEYDNLVNQYLPTFFSDQFDYEYVANKYSNYLQYYENNLDKLTSETNFLDICNYNQYGISYKPIDDGIINKGLYNTFSEKTSIDKTYTFPKNEFNSINLSSEVIIDNQNITNHNLVEYKAYPVYSLSIDSGKYTERNFKKFIENNMGKVYEKLYDFNKGIFSEDYNKNIFTELLNFTEHNNESKFTISFNKSIGSISFRQFGKIFESHKVVKTLVSKFVYYNSGFPFIYFKLPILNIPNNSIIYLNMSGALDNVPNDDLLGIHKIVIPNSYTIKVRQLMPLPKIDYIDSNKYLFSKEGYNKETNKSINNKYEEYVNHSVNKKYVKKFNEDYIIKRLKHIRESIHDSDYTSPWKLQNIEQEYDYNGISINSNSFFNQNLKKSYVNSKGLNEYYNSEIISNGSNIFKTTDYSVPLEYSGQAMINSKDNHILYRESNFFQNKTYSGGLETAFLEHELFMRIIDVESNHNNTIIGHISYVSKNADTYGNHEISFNLFSESNNCFSPGDIIVGLDSGTVAMILPNEYVFDKLPNKDIITLGLGNYLLNYNSKNSYFFTDFIGSISNSKYLTRDLALDYISKLNKWPLKKNKTDNGFYIRTRTVPNVSRTNGIIVNNFEIYLPKLFRFLSGNDTPLDIFGFKNNYYNNSFSYFKNNFTNLFEIDIKYSYIINNNLDCKQYLILETYNIDNFNIDDEVYVEDHITTLRNIDYRKNILFKCDNIISFADYISKIRDIYNLHNRLGLNSKFNVVKKQVFKVNDGNLDILDKFNDGDNYNRDCISDPYWNYTYLGDTDTKILYYTEINGNISKVIITKLGTKKLVYNKIYNITSNLGSGARVKYKGKGLFDIVEGGEQYGMDFIPFENIYLASPFNQDYDNFSEKYNLIYTQDTTTYYNELGSYFMIETIDEYYIDIKIAVPDKNLVSLAEKYNDNRNIFLSVYDKNGNILNYVLKRIYINNTYKNVFVKPGLLSYQNFHFNESEQYYIFINVNRPYIAFNKYDLQNNHYTILETVPISILNRILISYYTKNNNLNLLGKELEIFNKYNQINFSNRIIKIKVCPIDDKGFSYENANYDYTNPNNIEGPLRQVPNYSKNLFPYHENINILNYISNIDGDPLELGNREILRYSRIKQKLDNNHHTFKQFLPGMGVYTIAEDISQGQIIGNLNTMDSYTKPDAGTFNPNFIYSKYKYTSKFIGYVLNTSIENIDELNTSYRLNSDNFSKSGIDESIYSEYYLYVLIDPSLTTQIELDNIFDELNKDNVHYVFDGSADKVYGESDPLIEPGITNTGGSYSVRHDGVVGSDNYILELGQRATSSSTTAVNAKNIYGTFGIDNTDGVTRLFDDNTYSTFLSQNYYEGGSNYYYIFEDTSSQVNPINGNYYRNCFKYVDLLQNSLLGCIVIEKDILNKTLEGYSYDKRIACATQVERPVYLCKNNKSDKYDKLFNNGSLELLYREQLKNKCVMKYKPIFDEHHFRNLNMKNIIIEDNISFNNKVYNDIEVNDHSLNIDMKGNNQVYNNLKSVDKELVNGINPIYTFDNNSDLVLIDSYYKSFKYNSGHEYETFLGNNNPETIFSESGIQNRKIDILLGQILPNMYIDNDLSYMGEFNKITENTCLLDLEYNDSIKLSNKNISYGKYKSDTRYIAGYNSSSYTKSSISENSDYHQIYNEISEVLEIGNILDIDYNREYGYIISTYDISILRKNDDNIFTIGENILEQQDENNISIPILKNMMMVLSGYIQDKNGNEPFNKPNNTELGVIDEVIVIPKEISYTINKSSISEGLITSEIETKFFSEKTLLFKFKNRLINDHHNSSLGNKYFITYPVLYTNSEINYNEIYTVSFDKNNNNSLHFDFMKPNDIVMFDFGNKRNINISEDQKPPFRFDIEKENKPSSSFNEIEDVFIDNDSIQLKFNSIYILYPENTSLILLKNILIDHNFYDETYLDPLPYNNISTQPFISNNEWYTKIFYNSPETSIGKHINNIGKYQQLFNIEESIIKNKYHNKFYTSEIFIHSMKGLSIPFQNLNLNSEFIYPNVYEELLFMEPCNNDTFNTFEFISNDYKNNILQDDYIPLKGKFLFNKFTYDKNNIHSWQYSDINSNLNYTIIKGIYFGFGGIIEERYNSKSINNILSNEFTNRIARIKEVNNKFFMFLELDTNKSPLVIEDEITNFKSSINQSARSDQLEYDTLLSLIETNLTDTTKDYQNSLTRYGYGGKVLKKKVEHPYNLNPNNYLFMLVPTLDNIVLAENSKVNGAFGKILLPGDSNKTLFNSFISANKIFSENLFNNLTELEIAFITNDGYLFDFNGAEHSFALEITELIDKFEYINPRFGNIEF